MADSIQVLLNGTYIAKQYGLHGLGALLYHKDFIESLHMLKVIAGETLTLEEQQQWGAKDAFGDAFGVSAAPLVLLLPLLVRTDSSPPPPLPRSTTA